LPHKRRLVPSSTRVAHDGVSSGTDEVIKAGELNNERVVVLLVEGTLLEEVAHELALELEAGPFLRGGGVVKGKRGIEERLEGRRDARRKKERNARRAS
jgi:hypothetical protein